MSEELVERDQEDIGLTEAQVGALEKLNALGAEPRKKADDPYDPNPKVRALQLIYEGKIGGAGRGQGRKRKPRAAEAVAEHVRKNADKFNKVLDKALEHDDVKINLQAFDAGLAVERKEVELQLKEDEADDSQYGSREELVAAIIELAGDPRIEATVLEHIDIPEEDIEEVEVVQEREEVGEGSTAVRTRASATSKSNGNRVSGRASRNGRNSSKGSRSKTDNPFSAAKRRRAAN